MDFSLAAIRRALDRSRPKTEMEVGTDALVIGDELASVFLSAVGRQAWRELTADATLRNNGSRVRLRSRDVKAGARYVLTNPEALKRLIEELRLEDDGPRVANTGAQ